MTLPPTLDMDLDPTKNTDIPIGFVQRECVCTYYHYGQGHGYLLEACIRHRQSVIGVWIGPKPQKLPTDQPYEVLHALAVARIFEALHKRCWQASLGEDFLALVKRPDVASTIAEMVEKSEDKG